MFPHNILYFLNIVLPFDEDNAKDLFDKICTADFRYPQTFSESVISLIDNILTLDPDKRFTIKQIKQHPWFQSQRAEDQYFELDEKELIITPNLDSNNTDIIAIEDKTPKTKKTGFSFTTELHKNNDNNNDNNSSTKKKKASSMIIKVENETKSDTTNVEDQAYAAAVEEDFWRVVGRGPSNNNNNNNQKKSNKKRSKSKPNSRKNSKKSDIDMTPPTTPSFSYSNNSEILTGSEYESPESTPNPGIPNNNNEPVSMTAFDLIGIVSTQMLNNVFTRSLNDNSNNNSRKSTRIMCTLPPKKILHVIQISIDRIADCTCKLLYDKFEVKAIKRQGHRMIHMNIKIFSTPSIQYMIECRRTSGNIFRYHDFFDEFKNTFNEVVDHYKNRPSKLHILDLNNDNNSNSNDDNNNRFRTISQSSQKSNTLQPIVPQLKKKKKKNTTNRSSSEGILMNKNNIKNNLKKRHVNFNSNTLQAIPQELPETNQKPTHKTHNSNGHHSSYHSSNLSQISIKSNVSSNQSSSHHGSIPNAYNLTPSYDNNDNKKFFNDDIQNVVNNNNNSDSPKGNKHLDIPKNDQ